MLTACLSFLSSLRDLALRWGTPLLFIVFTGPLWFCGVVAMFDRGQPLGAVVALVTSWSAFFSGLFLLAPRWAEPRVGGIGIAVAVVLLLATAVLFLPELLWALS